MSEIVYNEKKPLPDEELDKIYAGYQFAKNPTNMPERPPVKTRPLPPGLGPPPAGPHPD